MLRAPDPAESPACALWFSHIRGERVAPRGSPGWGEEGKAGRRAVLKVLVRAIKQQKEIREI